MAIIYEDGKYKATNENPYTAGSGNLGAGYGGAYGAHPDRYDELYKSETARVNAANSILKSQSNSGGGGGHGGGGGGGGGGYSAPPRPNYEKYYAATFKPGRYSSQAAKIIDAQIAEAIRQNSAAKNKAGGIHRRALGEIDLQQGQSTGQLYGTHRQETGRLNNMMANRAGMSVGGGAYQNYADQDNTFNTNLASLINQFDSQRREQNYTLSDKMYDLNEADRVVRNQRGGLLQQLIRELTKEGFDYFDRNEARRLAAINQRNSTLG